MYRTDMMNVSRILYNNNKFSFLVEYEGVNGDTLYNIEGEVSLTNELIITKPKQDSKLNALKTQIQSRFETEELEYDEVLRLLEKAKKSKKIIKVW